MGLRLVAALGLLALQAIPASAEVALEGAVLIDGTRRGARHATVLIRGERIAAILPAGSPVPSGTEVVDLGGRTVIPGLSDAYWPLVDSPEHPALAELLRSGVTSVRGIGPIATATTLRHALDAGAAIGPRLVAAGDPIEIGPEGTETQVREEVRRRLRQGAKWALLGPWTPPQLLRAAVAEAGRGLPVAGPLWRTPWTIAARAGVDVLLGPAPWSEYYLQPRDRERFRAALSREGETRAQIEWLGAVDVEGAEMDRLIRWLRRRKVTVVPHLAALEERFLGDRAGRALWPKLLRIVRRFHDGGVLLAAGSGPGSPPSGRLHAELLLLAAAGIPPVDLVGIAARAGGGTLEVGARADLAVLGASPLLDPTHFADVETVYLGGRAVGGRVPERNVGCDAAPGAALTSRGPASGPGTR
jgi:hypothetical protein